MKKLFLFLLLIPCGLLADDVDIYRSAGTDARVMFVLDASGSMLDRADGSKAQVFSQTKMSTLLDALEEVIDGVAGEPGLGVGLTYYGGIMASGMKMPALPLSHQANLLHNISDPDDTLTHAQVLKNVARGIFPEEDYFESGFDLRKTGLWTGNSNLTSVDMSQVPECVGTPISTFLQSNGSVTEDYADKDPVTNFPVSWGGWAGTNNNVPVAWLQKCPVVPDVCNRKFPDEKDPSIIRWDPDQCNDASDDDLFAGEWGFCTVGDTVQVTGCESKFFSLLADAGELTTPTVDALYETALYFRGDTVYHGTRDHFPSWSDDRQRYYEPLQAVQDFFNEDDTRDVVHGFPGLLEPLSSADNRMFAEARFNFSEVMTGPLWGWRSVNPATLTPNPTLADPYLKRRYIEVNDWDDAVDTLDNNIFEYDCTYNIDKKWSLVHDSFRRCNLVESPSTGIIDAIAAGLDNDKIRKVDLTGSNAGYKGPTRSPYFECVEKDAGFTFCEKPKPNPGVVLCPKPGETTAPVPGCIVPTVSNCASLNGAVVTIDTPERSCDFKFESVAKYESPIGQCTRSAIILISDGVPSANTTDNGGRIDLDQKINEFTPEDLSDHRVDSVTPGLVRKLIADNDENAEAGSAEDVNCALPFPAASTDEQKDINKSGRCGAELSRFIAEVQQVDGASFGTVTVNTIGFGLPGTSPAVSYLESLATASTENPGLYESATNREDLIEAINSMVSQSQRDVADAPALVINLDNSSLTSSNVIYVPQFKASANPIWAANIKAYFLDAERDDDGNDIPASHPFIVNEGTRSFWSNESAVTAGADQDILEAKIIHGGINSMIVNNPTRNMQIEKLVWPSEDLDDADDTTVKSSFIENSDFYPAAALGISDEASRVEVVSWFKSQPLSDSLHSKPVQVSYEGLTLGNGVDDPDILYVVSNRGLIHAFDVSNAASNYSSLTSAPRELWAWMPRSLRNTMQLQYNATEGNDHIYGLDGELRVFEHEDKKYLIFGMRRGGSAYYMWDITNPEAPKIIWRIDPEKEGFAELGQTWSPMSVLRVKWGDDGEKLVGVFGGGYNEANDVEGETRRFSANTSGRGVYIIDLGMDDNWPECEYSAGGSICDGGTVIASLGSENAEQNNFTIDVPGMRYSVPSEIRAIDADSDGFADRLYFGDMGANLWRVDLANLEDSTASGAVEVRRMADLGVAGTFAETGAATEEDNRKFYEPPAVTRLKTGDLGVVIASGYRAQPLNGVSINPDTSERYPVIKDRVYMVVDDTAPINASLNGIQNPFAELTNVTGTSEIPEDSRGWYLDLVDPPSSPGESATPIGEKVLSEPVIFDGNILFTTTIPEGQGAVCSVVPTKNRFYSIKIANAAASGDLDEVDPVTGEPVSTPGTGVMSRFTEIDSTNAIESEIAIEIVNGGGGGSAGDSTSGCAPGEQCGNIYAGTSKVANFALRPGKVYWKETPRASDDCRFSESCGSGSTTGLPD